MFPTWDVYVSVADNNKEVLNVWTFYNDTQVLEHLGACDHNVEERHSDFREVNIAPHQSGKNHKSNWKQHAANIIVRMIINE